jgi:hypothetical protein
VHCSGWSYTHGNQLPEYSKMNWLFIKQRDLLSVGPLSDILSVKYTVEQLCIYRLLTAFTRGILNSGEQVIVR